MPSSEPLCPGEDFDMSADIAAVTRWVEARGSRSPRTHEIYVREAYFFLSWLASRRTSLRSVTLDDAQAYVRELGEGGTLRRRALSPESVDYVRGILGTMMAFLRDIGHVDINPFRSLPTLRQNRNTASKFLDLDTWTWLWSWLVARSDGNIKAMRERFVFAFLYATGLRREEAVAVRMSDLFLRDGTMFLRVQGKGGVVRDVIVNSFLRDELRLYRATFGLPAELGDAAEEARYPIIMATHPKRRERAMTPRMLGIIISEVAETAAVSCPSPNGRRALRAMSPHWLRHTNATHRLLAGAALETVQDELGHALPQTTRIYARTLAAARRRDAEKFAALMSASPDRQDTTHE